MIPETALLAESFIQLLDDQITSSMRSTHPISCNKKVKMLPSGTDKAANPLLTKETEIET